MSAPAVERRPSTSGAFLGLGGGIVLALLPHLYPLFDARSDVAPSSFAPGALVGLLGAATIVAAGAWRPAQARPATATAGSATATAR